ncbi:hypothetical protein ACP43V_10440 [Vibrio genomosp. F10 str. 9ZC157]|uniref:hypothetical protein n=1 Tax=Vibrio genomosp. F10 TaxID=723171 RepID=UPI0003172290|nr:hypothetical protein [Vibrio genomosp. F10]OEE95163.1 hypothetical protein A1QM_18110 [Vibrio genomosp. F10 str. 9ZC157]
MKGQQVLGLVKFFRNEEYLDKLIEGCFHCTPPEVYRLANLEGVSDKFESCRYSYRDQRKDPKFNLKICGIDLSRVAREVTITNGFEHNSWMHCWFLLKMPSDESTLDELRSDIARMKSEFGEHYAFVPITKFASFVERLKKNSSKELFYGEVQYDHDKSNWGNLCKSNLYSYQREFRFLFGSCDVSEVDYYVFDNAGGLGDIVLKNEDIKITSKNGDIVWLELCA